MLICARLRHVAGTQWGNKKYMNMKHLEVTLEDTSRCFMFTSAFRQLSRAKQTITRYAGGEKGYTKKLTDQLQ